MHTAAKEARLDRDVIAEKATRSAIAGPILAALAYYATAILALVCTQGADGIATLWPPSGILLAALFAARGGRRRYVALAALASLAANLQGGTPPLESVGFTIANMTETVLVAALLRRWCGTSLSFIAPRDVLRFVAASTIGAATSAVLAWASSDFGPWTLPWSWFATDLLGLLIVAPMMLTAIEVARGGRADLTGGASLADAAAVLALVAVVAGASFWQTGLPILFLPMVALFAATHRLGPFGAAAGVLLIAMIGSLFTGLGHGPVEMMHATREGAALFLQFYLLVLFATALPIAAILAARAQLLQASATSERMYRLLADHSNDMIVRVGLDGVYRYVSPAARAILGLEPAAMVGTEASGWLHPEDRAGVIALCQGLAKGIPAPLAVYRQRRGDGNYVWLEGTFRLVRDPDTGRSLEFIASGRDVGRRQAAEMELRETGARMQESVRLLSMAERVAQVGHWRLDAATRAMFWSPQVYLIYGLPADEAPSVERSLASYHPNDREMVRGIVAAALTNGGDFSYEARIVRGDGGVRHIVSRGQAELGPGGSVLGVFGVLQDITRQVEAEHALEAARAAAEQAALRATTLAETDELTGLASRRKALRWLDRAIAEARTARRPLSLAIFDVDYFKAVNDRYGHAVGDEVLKRLGRTAATVVRANDLVGRLGGEEFVAILPGADTALAMTIAERLRAAIEAAGGEPDQLPRVTASIGVATLGPDGTATQLLHRADCALYEAKKAGRNALRLAA